MTIETLAGSLGLDRSTVSNNLRLLRLPAYVLAHVDAGALSAHGAREFLCLMGSDGHFHDDIARIVLDRLTKGAPDWRVGRIRFEIPSVLRTTSVRDWRKLFDAYGNGGDGPAFDIAAFREAKAPQVHTIAEDDWDGGGPAWGKLRKEGSREWTCATSAWAGWQNAVKRTGETAAASSPKADGSAAPAKTASFARQLAQDPVYKAVSGETQGERRAVDAKGALTDYGKEKLGTRAEPKLLTRAGFKALVDERRAETYGIGSTDIPSYFPEIAECRKTCTIGATLAHTSETAPLYLWCLNKEHFEEKVAKGAAVVAAKVERQVAAIDQADAKAVAILQAQAGWSPSPALARFLAALLAAQARYQPVAPPNVDYRERGAFARWPGNVLRIHELLGIDPPKPFDYYDHDHWKKLAGAIPRADLTAVKETLIRLLVNEAGAEPALAPPRLAIAQTADSPDCHQR